MMWRWQQRDLSLPFLWPLCILMTFALCIGACKGGGLSESKFLFQFIRTIDPKNMLEINSDGHLPDHCSVMLTGIKCDMLSLNITEIRLENLNLSGTIDADSLCKLSSLQVLSLATNLVHGVIPESISNCLGLTYLNLSSNMLHGTVPASLNSLKSLRSLDLLNNNLTGPVPQFKQEIELSYSNTRQSGTSNGKYDAARKAFNELTRFLPLLLSLALFSLFVFFTYKKNPKSTDEKNTVHILESNVKEHSIGTEDDRERGEVQSHLVFFGERFERFSIDDLLRSEAELQGQNFYSTLYKVRLTEAAIFAVKRLKILQVSVDDFRRKLRWIGNLRHPNLLPLVAFNSSENEKLLIYGYQKAGSLASLLSSYAKKKRDFPWRQRLSIIRGIARGLDYIARVSSEENAPHGNLKPSNIILSDTEEPLISEYGIWGFLDPMRTFLYSSNGYRAPEKRLTKEADIFSFGVILLELLTGKVVEKSSVNLPKWVKSMVREEWTGEVFDREVRKVGKQFAFPLLNVALKCVSDLPKRRPGISEVLEKIEHVINSQEDCSFSSISSVESIQQDHILIHTVITETG